MRMAGGRVDTRMGVETVLDGTGAVVDASAPGRRGRAG